MLALDQKIYIAGHQGMAGSALMRRLQSKGYANIITATHAELDLTCQAQTEAFYQEHRPDIVIIAAAKVGGIYANSSYPADFLYQNLSIATHSIQAAYHAGVQRLLFLGSSCIYPKLAPQPMPEDCLLSSPLENSNEAYAIAKIAGLKLCQYYRQQHGLLFHSAMPTNLYGPGDNYHPQNSHVLPALIRRFHEAKMAQAPCVSIWGSGTPRREFLHADDLASALHFLLEIENPPDWINVGTGCDISILELAELVKNVVGFAGNIELDPNKPDGTPRKLMNVSTLSTLGWQASIPLSEGITRTYQDFLKESDSNQVRW